jgi:DNA helicase-2/ATP-dependent DNA helicase PcrA
MEPAIPSRFLTEMGDTIAMTNARPERKPLSERRWESNSSYFTAPVRKTVQEPAKIITGTKPEPPRQAQIFTGKTGDRVRHKVFGDGIILGSEGTGASMIVQIRFDNGAVKKLAAGFAPLTILE